MLTLPNIISLTRIPLALIFLQENIVYRLTGLILAMMSDVLDGYFARRYQWSTRVGTLLDPLMDKLFVCFVLGILIQETNPLAAWQLMAFFCRDLAVFIYGCYLILTNKLSQHRFRSIWCGKLSTFFQFIVLVCLTLNIAIPPTIFTLFLVLGILALFELYFYAPPVPS